MSECKLWTGANNKGYGVRKHNKRTVLVHRLAYCEANGLELEHVKGLLVCHTCDTPACYNPDHLFLGTHKDNVDDMMAKGRDSAPKGEDHTQAKLTRQDVGEIRALYASTNLKQRHLAKMYGVAISQISRVVNKKTWKG